MSSAILTRQNGGIVPGKQPGYYDVNGKVVFLGDMTDAIIYDSEWLPAAITAGQQFDLFVNNTFTATGAVKTQGLHFNVPIWGQMPKDWDASIMQLGFATQAGIPSDDLFAIMNGGYFELITGNTKSECDGLLWQYPSGFGVAGAVAADGNAVPVEVSGLNIGTPAAGAVGLRMYPIPLTEQLAYDVRLRFPAAVTLRAARLLYCVLKVVRKRPVR